MLRLPWEPALIFCAFNPHAVTPLRHLAPAMVWSAFLVGGQAAAQDVLPAQAEPVETAASPPGPGDPAVGPSPPMPELAEQAAVLMDSESEAPVGRKDKKPSDTLQNPWLGMYSFVGGGIGIVHGASYLEPAVRITGGLGGHAGIVFGTLALESDFSVRFPIGIRAVATAGFTTPTRTVRFSLGPRIGLGIHATNTGPSYTSLIMGVELSAIITPKPWRYGLRIAVDYSIDPYSTLAEYPVYNAIYSLFALTGSVVFK